MYQKLLAQNSFFGLHRLDTNICSYHSKHYQKQDLHPNTGISQGDFIGPIHFENLSAVLDIQLGAPITQFPALDIHYEIGFLLEVL